MMIRMPAKRVDNQCRHKRRSTALGSALCLFRVSLMDDLGWRVALSGSTDDALQLARNSDHTGLQLKTMLSEMLPAAPLFGD